MNRVALVLASGLLASAAACSSSETSTTPSTAPSTSETTVTSARPPTSESATTEPAATSPAPTSAATAAVTVGAWTAIPGGPGCECSDGSPYEIWERRADPTKVVLYLQGGGACFSAETCGAVSQTYTKSLELGQSPGSDGIFDPDDPRNPLADHSVVYVPYCTGDVHLGDRVNEYSDTVTISHSGFTNASFGLDRVLAEFPDVDQLVVAGGSAGSVPAPAFAGLAADELSETEIVAFGDSSGAYPDAPELNVDIGGQWGVLNNVPDWPVNEGLTAEEWSFPGLYVQAGTQHPDITFGRFDHADDAVQAFFLSLAGIPTADLLANIEQTEAQIESEGVPIASYVAPGGDHTILTEPGFYEMEVEGVALVDFLTELVDGGLPADVACVDCRAPS